MGDSTAVPRTSVAARHGGLAGAVLMPLARRPVLAVFAVALAVRAVVAAVIWIGWGGSLFLDDASYSQIAAAAADGRIEDAYAEFLYERTATLLVPITGLYELFGPVKLLGQLYVALLGAATAALTARLAMEVVDRRWALLAGLIVALLPSQVLWSSLILKDAAVWAALNALALVVAVAARTGGRRLVLLGLSAAVLLAALGFLRLHTLEVACVALLLAVLASPRPRPVARLGGAAVLLACVPLAFGMGVAGGSFVADSRNPAEQRSLNALEADSAVVAPAGDAPQGGLEGDIARQADDASPASASLRYLPTGVTVVALRPWPWEASDTSLGVRLARAETLVWYPLLLLGMVGLASVWRQRRALAFPVLAGGAILALYGVTEGNLGTAYRHRGEFVWIVALLATLGARRIAAWRGERRRAAGPA